MRLVADDFIGITQTIRALRKLLAVCESWDIRNGLKCNPSKSQVLRINPAGQEQDEITIVDGVQLQFVEVVEYL